MSIFISFGKIDKKYIWMFLGYIILEIGIQIIYNKIDYCFYFNYRIIFEVMLYMIQAIFFYIIEFIRNKKNSLHNNTSKINNSFKFIFLIIGLISLTELIYLFLDILKDYIYMLQYIDIDSSYLDLLCLLISSYYFMKDNFYKHHYISAIIILIIGNIKNIVKLISEFSYLINIFYLLLKSTSLSIIYGLYKKLMDQYYFSPYKLSYVIGLINMTILIVISIILMNIPMGENIESFCRTKDEDNIYFINLDSFIIDDNANQIIILSIITIFYSMQKLLIKMIIQDFTLCHTFIPIKISNIFLNKFYYNLYIYNEEEDKINHTYEKYIIYNIVYFIIEFLISLIFLEFIELNFCGLSKNIKKKYKNKSQKRFN